jgi:hypothetical protein
MDKDSSNYGGVSGSAAWQPVLLAPTHQVVYLVAEYVLEDDSLQGDKAPGPLFRDVESAKRHVEDLVAWYLETTTGEWEYHPATRPDKEWWSLITGTLSGETLIYRVIGLVVQ